MKQADAKKLVGKKVYAVHKNGRTISGKLVKVSGNTLYVQPQLISGKKVRTSAVLPLALFDLLAIGTSPFAFGGVPFGGFGGFGFGGVPFGGFPGGFFW